MTRLEALRCAKRAAVFGDRTLVFPRVMEDMEPFCKYELKFILVLYILFVSSSVHQAMDCFDEYRFCLKGFLRTFTHMMVNHVKSELNTNLCDNDIREGKIFMRFYTRTHCMRSLASGFAMS